MTVAQLRKFEAELADAEKIAAQRKALPELTADEILEGFRKQRERRSADVEGFGRIYYFHPMTAAERYELQEKLEKVDQITAKDLVTIVIARACNADGSPKFKPEHADALLRRAPAESIGKLVKLLFENRITIETAEKK
jgi:hypothetical protein